MDNKENVSLNFHASFNPDFEYIAKIVQIADDCEGLSKEEISGLTGMPTGASSGKVEPHINYAKFMNLIDFKKEGNKYHIYSTSLGNVIKNEDLYFLENLSKLICNYFLTSKIYGAPMWYRIVRYMRNKYGSEIKESVALKDLSDEFNIKINMTPFRSCYKNDKSLASLNLINVQEVDNENVFTFNKNKYDDENIYVYAYTLIRDLEGLDFNRKEFLINEVFEIIAWHRGYCWDEDIAMMILEKLNDLNIISLNRQLNPITVIINTKSEDIVNEIYSLLI
ncbi:hypothetical protein QOZ83_01135 [Romboutsia sedimentorum]|uniref:hypothetical protein n=1 Tax=Romboutsia sedimentorum TaxID=1368474 RepID=UPI0024DE63DC|nr:hypothetical protein [Romboutsia sedimentorum]MDK2584449.1 hypothetical protein [Romboutsia sedimentorum]